MHATRLMLAFHNDPALKEQIHAIVLAHRKADKLIKGHSVGRALEGVKQARGLKMIKHSSHALGIPRVLAFLEDYIFERLPERGLATLAGAVYYRYRAGCRSRFGVAALRAVAPGEELPGKVSDKFPQSKAALANVAALYREWIETGAKPSRARCVTARDDALAAQAGAPGAASAAIAAAYAAATAAATAAYAAAYAAHLRQCLLRLRRNRRSLRRSRRRRRQPTQPTPTTPG